MQNITVVESGVLYDNLLPQLKSRQAYFPSVIQLPDESLLASYAIGEALESLDQTTVMAISRDKGRTWENIGPVYDKSKQDRLTSDTCKLTYVIKNKILAFGYRFLRDNPELPIGNPETGGLLKSEVIIFESADEGHNFNKPTVIPTSFSEGVEASAPIYVLSNGQWVTPIANFPYWDGSFDKGAYGRLLRSEDEGRTWDDSAITMKLPGSKTAIWEQRSCELESGKIVVIAWIEDLGQGRHLPNHYAISNDYGKSFGQPKSTGIMGQASSVYYLGNNKVLSLHCIRRDTDKPGILACIVDLGNDDWQIINQQMIWEPIPYRANSKRHDIFAFMKFGQPSVIRLYDGDYFMHFWYEAEGQSKILWNRLRIN